jgi:hypothetical protein
MQNTEGYPQDRAEFFLSEKIGAALQWAESKGLSTANIVGIVMAEMAVRPEYGGAFNAWLANAATDEGMQGLEIPCQHNCTHCAQ